MDELENDLNSFNEDNTVESNVDNTNEVADAEFDEKVNNFIKKKNKINDNASNIILGSIKKTEDVEKFIYSISDIELRTKLLELYKESGAAENSIIKSQFSLMLNNSELFDQTVELHNKTIELHNDFSKNFIKLMSDSLGGVKVLFDKLENDTVEKIDLNISQKLDEFTNIDTKIRSKTNSTIEHLNKSLRKFEDQTYGISNRFAIDLHEKVKGINEVIGGTHELQKEVASELVLKAINDIFIPTFNKASEKSIKNHNKEVAESLGRFGKSQMSKQIFIYSSSLFIAGVGLLASYKYVLSFIS